MTDPRAPDQALLEALRLAVAPEELDLDVNEALITQALGLGTSPPVPLEPPATEGEWLAAEALRLALDGEELHSPEAELLGALSAAWRPEALDTEDLSRALAPVLESPSRLERRRRGLLGRSLVGALAVAAAGLLVFRVASTSETSSARSEAVSPADEVARAGTPEGSLAISRSTAPLFQEPFETAQTTHRIDRIVAMRGREMRHNRYLGWRVE